MLELLDDMLELQPTLFFSVPRLYSRVYDRVMTAMREGNPISRRLFETAFAQKKAAIERGDLSGGRFAPLWDRLVFSKIAARLGGAWPLCKFLLIASLWCEGHASRGLCWYGCDHAHLDGQPSQQDDKACQHCASCSEALRI